MFQDEVVCIDLETTGLNSERDRIIDVGAVKFKNGKITDTFASLVNPGIEIAQITTAITGISSKELEAAPKFEEIKAKLKKFIGKAYVLGHNVQFDLAFLAANGLELDNRRLDTFELAPIAFPGRASYALGYLTDNLDIRHEEKHRALSDSLATTDLFLKILEQVSALDKRILEKMQIYLERADWQAVEIFKEALSDAKIRSHKSKAETDKKSKKKIKQLIEFDPKKIWEMFDEEEVCRK
jgi:DNA polymerase III epsilon subunit family exonuclease